MMNQSTGTNIRNQQFHDEQYQTLNDEMDETTFKSEVIEIASDAKSANEGWNNDF